MPDGRKKTLFTNEINVCAGLGFARRIAPYYTDQATYSQLNRFDKTKGYTPLVDGNQFMLTDSEEKSPKRRKILVYGGGGNATACFAKAFFSKDGRANGTVYQSNNQYHDFLWFSRNGFNEAGRGTQAKQAIDYANKDSRLFCGELKKIEFDPKTQKIQAIFELKSGTYQGIPIKHDQSMLNGLKKRVTLVPKETRHIDPVTHKSYKSLRRVECVVFEIDQFVESVGQVNKGIQGIFNGIDLRLRQPIEYPTDIPTQLTGLESKDGNIRIYGAAAQALGWKPDQRGYFDKTRKWIVEQKFCADSEWPGVMPPSRAQVRLDNFLVGKVIPSSVNLNTDDLDKLIPSFLWKGGADWNQIDQFKGKLYEKRQETEGGITKKSLEDILKSTQLDNKFELAGHSHLLLKNSFITKKTEIL